MECYHCNYKIDFEEHDFSESDKCACGYVFAGTDGLEYELVNGYYVVKSIGTATDKNIYIPSAYEGKEVLKIGENAFKDCAEILSVRIPESINEIGVNAFANCTGITSVTLPQNLRTLSSTAFAGCTALESLSISGGNENGYYASVDGIIYAKNSSTGVISSIHILPWAVEVINVPDGVTAVSLSGYTNLKKVIFGEESKLTKLAISAFEGCTALTEVVLPANLTEIGNKAFSKCSELTVVVLPEKLTTIGQMAFQNCKKLYEINIPSSVTSLGNYAFTSCAELAYVTFGENIKITAIGNSVFSSCTQLKEIIIPEGVKTLGNMAFLACRNLTSLTLPQSLVTIGDSVFQNCEKLTSVSIPDNVTSIGGSAFKDCTMISELTFGENSKLQTTATLTFGGLTALTSVTLPDSLTSLSNGMFNGCTNLAEVNIGENSKIATIGNMVFINTAITSIVIPALTVPEEDGKYSIGGSVFNGCENLEHIYYMGSAEDWAGLTVSPAYTELLTDTRLCFYVANQADLPADGGSYWHFVNGKPVVWEI